MYGVSVCSIAAANKDIVDIDLVFKGQLLSIPASSLNETPPAKATGYFLVLVTLLAFCIGCIIHTFRIRVARNIKHQAVNKSKRHHPEPKSMRWKSALTDTGEGYTSDSESGLDSNNPLEGEAYNSNEEASHAYSRLQHDYQKFLSECGISEWGYWQGGSPGT